MKTRSLLVAGMVASFAAQVLRADDLFTRITSGPIVSGVDCTILAWGDFNNDGFQDLFVSTRTGPSLLYSNNGAGTFSRVLAGPVATDSGLGIGATWGDYDNDGFLDLFVGVNNAGNDWLYHNNSLGGFTKITTGAIVNSGGNANNTCWADYDNDGFLDLFVANSDQNDFLWHSNGDGTFTRILTNAIALKPGNSQGGSWGDYDRDGLPDLFVSRVNEPNLLYHNEGGGVFTAVTNGMIVHEVSVGQGTSWGDYDNDGYLDLFVATPNRPNFLYHNSGDGTFAKITNGPIVTDIASGGGCGWADYDNDGYLDLFVANRRGVNSLYHNTGTGTFTRVTNGVVSTDTGDAISGAWADYDNDGFQDLFVTHLGTALTNRLYHNNGNSNAWLTLKLEGRLSNRASIGAKVRVKATIGGRTVWQLREISGGGGLGSQNDLRAGFGLGNATNVDLIRLEWPSGIVQELHDIAPRQFLTFVEPEARVTPANVEVEARASVTFTVSTTLTPPVNFQWRFNGDELPGQTNETLVIQTTAAQHAGKYLVTVTKPDTGLTFNSTPAFLTGPAAITQQPRSLNVRPGSNAVFTVVARGIGPITYQWRFNGINLANATNATLLVTNAQLGAGGRYDVVVSNSYGPVFSAPADLGILINPAITIQPLSQSVVVGGTVTFSVAVTGNPAPFTFEWRRAATLWTNVTSAPMSFFTLTNVQTNQAGNYRVVIKNAANSQPGILSSNAVLTVLADIDGDGLPDEWESAHGLDPANAADATLDGDGDGMTNLDEYRCGTTPSDQQSYLRVESLTRHGTNDWALQFRGQSNRTYTVETCLNLTTGKWHRVADVAAASTNRLVEMLLPPEENQPFQIFRLVCPRQP